METENKKLWVNYRDIDELIELAKAPEADEWVLSHQEVDKWTDMIKDGSEANCTTPAQMYIDDIGLCAKYDEKKLNEVKELIAEITQ